MGRRRGPPPPDIDISDAAAPAPAKRQSALYTHSPAEYFIKYVLSSQLHAPIPAMTASLETHGLLLPSQPEVYVRRLATELEQRMPDPYKPEDAHHIPSQHFLHQIGVWDMWHPDMFVLEAVALYKDPKLRDQTRALLSADLARLDILRSLENTKEAPVSSKAIDYFIHYYWDLKLFSVDEREYFYSDYRVSRYVSEAGLGHGRVNKALALAKVYKMPTADHRKAFEDVFSDSYYTTGDLQKVRNPLERVYANQAAVRTMCDAHDRLVAMQQQDAAMAEGVSAITVTHLPRDTHTVHDMMTPGAQPKRLPGRLRAIPGGKEEGIKDGVKVN